MPRTKIWMTALACTLLLAAGVLTAGMATADDETTQEVRVVRIAHCEHGNGDCPHAQAGVHHGGGHHGEGPHQALFISEDGEVTHLTGDEIHWVGRGGGFLGVELTELTPELREHFGVGAETGVMVSRVVEDSPAAKAGIRVGDILTAVDGAGVASGQQLAREIRGHEAGDTVRVEVVRDGRTETLAAVVEKREGMAMPEGFSHMEHAARIHELKMKCGEGEEECAHLKELQALQLGCGEGEECKIEVRCEGEGCTCTVNGEEKDCGPLHQLHEPRLHREHGGDE